MSDEANLVSVISALERDVRQALDQRSTQVAVAQDSDTSLNNYLRALRVCDSAFEALRAAPVVALSAWREVALNARRLRAMVGEARVAAAGAQNVLRTTVQRLDVLQGQLIERRRQLAAIRSATARVYYFPGVEGTTANPSGDRT